MRKLSALPLCAVALLGLLSCQNMTDSLVDGLKYSDTPAWSGTSWKGSCEDGSITRYAMTAGTSGTETTETSILLTESVYDLELMADGSFSFTITSTYGPNWGNNYIPDNWNYSTSADTFSPPELAETGTDYSTPFINGAYRYSYSETYLPTTEYSISSTETTYGEQTVYPVTFSSTSTAAIRAAALVGKDFYVSTSSGTYVNLALSTNPVDSSSIPYLSVSSESETDRTFNDDGSVLALEVTNQNFGTGEGFYLNSYFDFTNGLVVNSEGKSVYSILYGSSYSYLKAMKSMASSLYSSGVILYQQ